MSDSPWASPNKNTRVGCYAFFRGLPDPGIEPMSLKSPAQAGRFFTTQVTGEAPQRVYTYARICIYIYV